LLEGRPSVTTTPIRRTTSGERELALDANERAWSMTDAELIEVECECGRAACPGTAELPRVAYERIRSSQAGFIVVPDHVRLGTERVTEAGDRYAVVQGKARRAGIGAR
jgi:hypothetical protein